MNLKMTNNDILIKSGLSKLSNLFTGNGFESFTSKGSDFSEKKLSSAVFPNFLVLDALNTLGDNGLKEKLTAFLLSQKSGQMSFNYWCRDSTDATKTPYPDDLDSTSCAFSSLDLLNGENAGEALAYFAMMLSSLESEEGGPYYTWIAPNDERLWKDIDFAVNANIAYALSRVGAELESLNLLMENAIESREFVSPYYETQFPVAFFISRGYSGKKKGQLEKWLIDNIDKAQNHLDLSFCLLGLINCGCDLADFDNYVKQLVDYIASDNESIYPFVIETNKGGVKEYSGSLSLQIALALQIINDYSNDTPKEQEDSSLQPFLFELESRMAARLKGNPDIKDLFTERSERITKKPDGKEIILISLILANSLPEEKKEKIDSEFLISLAVISLCGWIAYSIYDDFLDDEGNPLYLPLANFCLREIATTLRGNTTDEFFELSCKILDSMDSANLWEIQNARFDPSDISKVSSEIYGNYDMLSDRSMGHAIGPILVLSKLGFKADSSEVLSLISFFKNYIIARQLNDDLRDCLQDFKAGNLTPAVSVLLDVIRNNSIDPHDDTEINKVVWNDVLPIISNLSLRYSEIAGATTHRLSSLGDMEKTLQKILRPVISAAEGSKADQKTYISFLKTCG